MRISKRGYDGTVFVADVDILLSENMCNLAFFVSMLWLKTVDRTPDHIC